MASHNFQVESASEPVGDLVGAALPTHWKLYIVCYPLLLQIALPLDIAQYFTSQSPSFLKTLTLK